MAKSRDMLLYEYMRYFNRTEFKVMYELMHGDFTLAEIAEDTGLSVPRIREAMNYLTRYGMVFENSAEKSFAFQSNVEAWDVENIKSRNLYALPQDTASAPIPNMVKEKPVEYKIRKPAKPLYDIGKAAHR